MGCSAFSEDAWEEEFAFWAGGDSPEATVAVTRNARDSNGCSVDKHERSNGLSFRPRRLPPTGAYLSGGTSLAKPREPLARARDSTDPPEASAPTHSRPSLPQPCSPRIFVKSPKNCNRGNHRGHANCDARCQTRVTFAVCIQFSSSRCQFRPVKVNPLRYVNASLGTASGLH